MKRLVAATVALLLVVGLVAFLSGRPDNDAVDTVDTARHVTESSSRPAGRSPRPATPAPHLEPAEPSAPDEVPTGAVTPRDRIAEPTSVGAPAPANSTRPPRGGDRPGPSARPASPPRPPQLVIGPLPNPTAGPNPTTDEDPPATNPDVEPPPSVPRDQANCPNLGLVAIGDAGPAPEAGAASARFRVLAGPELEGPALVCAQTIRTWRDDLVIQRLVTAGQPDGALVSGRGHQDPVLRLSQTEWVSFAQFHDDDHHNFLGVPTGRVTIDGTAMVRTSRGALVMARPDAFGFGVVMGAWDVWMAHGGPSGDLGLPTARPDGTPETGAHQDFTFGHLDLPDARSGLEAEAAPASAYVWYPVTQPEREAQRPPINSILNVGGTSYYVDDASVRHWIASTADWGCASRMPNVTRHQVPGYLAAEYPLGPMFACG